MPSISVPPTSPVPFVPPTSSTSDIISKPARDTWAEYYFGIVDAVAKRATCDRGKCAAITVRDKRILTTGYVGAPSGQPHCDDVGHLFRTVTHVDGSVKLHCVRTIHAESNAIAQAAQFGLLLRESRLYSSMFPCFDCAKLCIAAGIAQVYAKHDYPASAESKDLFTKAGVHWIVMSEGFSPYTPAV